tara:strand:- start:356 stop:514 length:159 start_codon:yes stop_codon:yes gene_type:complete
MVSRNKYRKALDKAEDIAKNDNKEAAAIDRQILLQELQGTGNNHRNDPPQRE